MAIYILIFLVGILIVITAVILRKVIKIHVLVLKQRAAIKTAAETYPKVEALMALYKDLDLNESLPPLGKWVASADFLGEVVRHILEVKPKVILELGSGVSTYVIAKALQKNGVGHLYSLDHQPAFANKTIEKLIECGVENLATVIHAPLESIELQGSQFKWYSTKDLPDQKYDLLVVDGPPEATNPLARYPALPVLSERLSDNIAIFLDDADRPDETEMLAKWKAEFPTFLQTKRACEKGCAVLTLGQQ